MPHFSLDYSQSIESESGVFYKNVQFLGSGGDAVTYMMMATSGPNIGVTFAVKIFKKQAAQERKERFIEETNVLTGLQHPCVMRVFDRGMFLTGPPNNQNEHPFVVAEYLPRTLRAALRADSLYMPEKLSISLQLLSALKFISEQSPKIIHRDIKPENIFLKGRSCVLGDFGLMKLLDGTEEGDKDIFKQSMLPGMPFFYRTPDLVAYANNESDITIATDIFQLGLVLAELFTGWNPCKRPKDSKGIYDPVELENIGNIRGDNGAGIASILKRMLKINKNERETIDPVINDVRKVFEDVCDKMTEIEGRVY